MAKTNTPTTITKKTPADSDALRIRWVKLDDNIYCTKNIYVGKFGAKYQGFILLNEKIIRIKNINKRTYVDLSRKHSKFTNLRALKKFTKRILKKLGVKFDIEIR